MRIFIRITIFSDRMNFIAFSIVTALFAFPHITTSSLAFADDFLKKESLPDVFVKIAFCESKGQHFDEYGNVVIGVNPHDVGKYQINVKYWQEFAEKKGHDIYTEEGNEAIAFELYKRYGTAPWVHSKKCWSKEDPTKIG